MMSDQINYSQALTKQKAEEIATNFKNDIEGLQTGNYNSPQNFACNKNDQVGRAKIGVRQ